MTYKDNNKKEYWNDSLVPSDYQPKGIYISISGNTGVGKSTLVVKIDEYLKSIDKKNVISINERILHHPLLKLMFEKPNQYALLIQLNFLLQRILIIKHWLSLGYIVIIERSHLDDALFIEHHLEMKHISTEEYAIYSDLSKSLIQTHLSVPDLMILVSVAPELSFDRVTYAEQIGERPKEFPNDEIKKEYIYSWFKKYEAFFKQLQNSPETANRCFQVQNDIDINESVRLLLSKIQLLL